MLETLRELRSKKIERLGFPIKIQRYSFVLDLNAWPVVLAGSLWVLVIGFESVLQYVANGGLLLILGFILTFLGIVFWLRDVVREATFLGFQNPSIRYCIRIGMYLFIVSEVMFFLAFFWADIHSWIIPVLQLGHVWPPESIVYFHWSGYPLINTGILLSSIFVCRWIKHAIKLEDWNELFYAFMILFGLSVVFLFNQVIEYTNAPFGITDSVYGSAFFMLTGFHGFHVLLGTIAFLVMFMRCYLGHIERSFFAGIRYAIWYWHFVDVVWVGLYFLVYLLPII
jgi:heme/copper-type cytochrome/quinol oxidase subunit 3